MGIFDFLVDGKIKDFEDRKARGLVKPAEPIERKSFESNLLDDIKTLITQAAAEPNKGKSELLQKRARELEIHLSSSLERQGLNRLAGSMQGIIFRHREEVFKDKV